VFEGTATPAGGSWTFTTAAKPEGFYSITARSLAASIESSDSPSVSITIDRTAPSAPTNLRTTAYNNCIDLEWDASIAGDVAGYEVFRKTGASGTWTLLNTTGVVIGTKYRDATAVNGVTYFYRVEAIDNTVSN